MWSRISDLAVKIDANFGDVDGGGESQEEDSGGGATPSSGAEEEEEEEVEEEEEEEDGWGDDDDDDFDEDLEFSENNGRETPSLEKNDNGTIVVRGRESRNDREGAAAPFEDDDAVKAADDTTTSDVSAIFVVKEEENPSSPEIAEAHSPSGVAALRRENFDDRQRQRQRQQRRPDVVTVSAPGKALIAGGYLVLESPNPGVVLAAEGCRFHATVAFRTPHHRHHHLEEGSSSAGGGVVVVDDGWQSIPLDVYSPQFDRVFSYHLSYRYSPSTNGKDDYDDVALRLRPRTAPHDPNKFVERSLLLALGYLRQSMGAEAFHARLQRRHHHHHRRTDLDDDDDAAASGGGSMMALAMKLRADNDFYSQISRLRERGMDLSPRSLEMLEPFLPCPKDDSTGEVVVNKTGMGSSAALVASLVGALLLFFGVISLPVVVDGENGEGDELMTDDGERGGCDEGLRIAHNLSQICHCHAQGKVGSGFDISSAIYGSHIYTRFSEAFVDKFLENLESSSDEKVDGMHLSVELSRQLVALVKSDEWDCTFSPIGLPPGLELLMADVCGGSESPSMARGILEWKKKKRKVGFMDDYYWKDLKRCNKRIVSLFTDQFASQTFRDGLRRDGTDIISTRTAEQWKKPMPSSWHSFEGSSWDVALKLFDLRMAFLECRQNLKGMGISAGVPVEPDEQTAVADATMSLPGVVAAGVPGAGGYDALFVIYVKGPATFGGKSDRVRDEIGNLWRDMSDESNERVLCPLSVRAAGSGGGLCSTELDW